MKVYESPNPLIEAKQRIGYLKDFLGVVRPSASSSSYSGWLNHIRSDLNAITNETTRTKAKALFDQIVSAIHFPDENKVDGMIKEAIKGLIAYLEKHDC